MLNHEELRNKRCAREAKHLIDAFKNTKDEYAGYLSTKACKAFALISIKQQQRLLANLDTNNNRGAMENVYEVEKDLQIIEKEILKEILKP